MTGIFIFRLITYHVHELEAHFGIVAFWIAMAFITVSWDAPRLEQLTWLVIFIICAWLIAKNTEQKFFLHGFLVCMVNCAWTIGVHIRYADLFIAHHPKEAAQYAAMNKELGVSVAQSIMLVEPFKGVFSGIALGLFALIAAGFVAAIEDK